MKRRTLLAVGAGLSAPSIIARAQRSLPLVGMLMSGIESSAENRPRIPAFRQALADRGWRDGETVRVDIRWSGGRADLISRHADELVALGPNVILANSTPVIAAFKGRTTSIPIVFALSIDPVALGHVQSLAHPGGNVTGFSYIDGELIGKWLDLIKEVAPATIRVGMVFDATTDSFYEGFVRTLGEKWTGRLELLAVTARSEDELTAAVQAFANRPGGAVVAGPNPFNQVQIKHLARLALQHRLPAVSVYRPFVAEGGLTAYGPDTADIFRRAAGYVDRILKGAKPADLPVQQPTKFEFAINLATARALGLSIPPTLRALADEAID